ncbi:MAG TPA: pyridoxamine 5'-phosphate oxidase family protein [Pyrinomonadaceae bacterium]|nr:pyridoxamine 5'-phosphate oxidase family protein [Pyrinomonadaceae bacterium]
MIISLNDDEAWALLRKGRLARLGCIADGEPYVVPVNYAAEGACVLIHSLPGRKIRAMRANPYVCLQVDEITDHCHWRSVLAYGTYEEVGNGAERARAMNRLLAAFPQLTPVESRLAADAAAPSPIIFRIRVEQITGLCED